MNKPTTTIDRRNAHTKFYLDDMGEIFDRVNGQIDVPHRHDYYTVLLIEEAEGKHVIDYQQYNFGEKEVHFVSPGQVHQVAVTARPKGKVFTFTREFLLFNKIEESFISNINLFQSFGKNPPLQLDSVTFQRLTQLMEDMAVCYSLQLTHSTRALGAYLQLFLIYANNSKKFDQIQTDEEHSGVCILRDFKFLIDEKYTEWHKVKEYAAEIHISPKHLSQTVKDLTGKVAKDHIQDRIVLEAKRLLLHTEMSVKEVAYATGFEEPLHFSSFFKKKAGISPSNFRNQKL